MIDEATDLMWREIRAARRLVRLFRIERSGRFARHSTDTVRRLIDRRGQLIDELRRMELRRRSFAPWVPTELGLTMGQLAREVGRTEQSCLELLARLGAELRRLRGEGVATGLCDGADGRLLGRG
jgi:hypothetical protein